MTYSLTVEGMDEEAQAQLDRDLGGTRPTSAGPPPRASSNKTADALMAAFSLPVKR